MRKYIKRILDKDDGLLLASGIFLFGSLFSSIANYLYQIYMGRTLGPETYGVLGSLFAFIYIVQIGGGTITTVISHYTATYRARKDYGRLRTLITSSFRYLTIIGIILLGLFILLVPMIARFLKLDVAAGLILVGVLGFVSILFAVIGGYLNGLQRFLYQNVTSIISSGLKLVLGILFVVLGFGIAGAIGGVVAGIIIAFIVGFFALLRLRKVRPKKIKHLDVLKYAVPVLITTLIPALLITIDILLVKHFFSSREAGFFAAADNIAKIVWFASGFFVGVMFPKVVYLHARGKDTFKLFKSTLGYAALIVGAITLLYFYIPHIIVRLFYGAAYDISGLIGFYGLAFGLYSLNQIMIMYNLALKRYAFIYYVIGAIIVEIGLIFLFHTSLFLVILMMLLVLGALFVCLFFYTLRSSKKHKHL